MRTAPARDRLSCRWTTASRPSLLLRLTHLRAASALLVVASASCAMVTAVADRSSVARASGAGRRHGAHAPSLPRISVW